VDEFESDFDNGPYEDAVQVLVRDKAPVDVVDGHQADVVVFDDFGKILLQVCGNLIKFVLHDGCRKGQEWREEARRMRTAVAAFLLKDRHGEAQQRTGTIDDEKVAGGSRTDVGFESMKMGQLVRVGGPKDGATV
jgi:hypothetical protein